jgi:hypothetical protein
MILDPQRRGRALADFYRAVAPRLFADLEASGVLPAAADAEQAARVRHEWECLALYACVRGLVAGGGFNRETADAIDAFHASVLGADAGDDPPAPTGAEAAGPARRARITERYAEYGAIGQAGGKSGEATVAARLGAAAARHIARNDPPPAELAEWIGSLHETLAEGAAESVREGT